MILLPTKSDNPFAVHRVRPGALPFIFESRETAQRLIGRLATNDWRGQIFGPHGSGKSTLIASLIPRIRDAGRRVTLVTLHDDHPKLPASLRRPARLGQDVQLIVDGFEQMGRWSRWGLFRACCQARCGLLATAHRDVGLPDLYETRPNPQAIRDLIDRLLGSAPSPIGSDDIAAAIASRGENVREILFDLYNLYEMRTRQIERY